MPFTRNALHAATFKRGGILTLSATINPGASPVAADIYFAFSFRTGPCSSDNREEAFPR